MATIHDVAKRAGVSSATVSHVINESRVVTPETRKRVLEAIEELQYRRDGVARSLRRSRTGTIGLMVSDISNPFFSDLVRGVEDAITERHKGNNLILCNTDEDVEKEGVYIDVLLEKRIDGLILAPAGGNLKHLDDLVRRNFPIVMVDRELSELRADSVVVDNVAAAEALTKHLIALGHTRIGVMRAGLSANSIDDRLEGFRSAMSKHGLPVDPALIVQSSSDVDHATRAGLMLLSKRRPEQRPTAVFCTNNFMTLGLLRALSQSGLSCPHDVAVAGFDDLPWALGFHPTLTVVAQPAYRMGEVAVDLLFDRLGGNTDRPPVRRELETTLIIRESSGARPQMAELAAR